jgi:hypothetical protein
MRMQTAARASVDIIWLMTIVAIVLAPFELLRRQNDPAQAQMGLR